MSDWKLVRVEPSPILLRAMATASRPTFEHQPEIAQAIILEKMRRVHDEVVGKGFYFSSEAPPADPRDAEIAALKAEVERLREAGNYLATEVESAWVEGIVTIDALNAAIWWREKALRGEVE